MRLEKKVEEPQTARMGQEVPVVDKTLKQSIIGEEATGTREQQSQLPAVNDATKQHNSGDKTSTFTSEQQPQRPALVETSKQSNSGEGQETCTSQQQPQGPALQVDKNCKQSLSLQGPQRCTSGQQPQGPTSDKTTQQSNSSHGRHSSGFGPQVPAGNASASAARNVVFYHRDDTNLAVGFHHPERRILHGKPLPPGFDVVQLTWVNGSETPAPLILGDIEENASLSAGKFFALPRKNLVKVVASN